MSSTCSYTSGTGWSTDWITGLSLLRTKNQNTNYSLSIWMDWSPKRCIRNTCVLNWLRKLCIQFWLFHFKMPFRNAISGSLPAKCSPKKNLGIFCAKSYALKFQGRVLEWSDRFLNSKCVRISWRHFSPGSCLIRLSFLPFETTVSVISLYLWWSANWK